MAQQAVRREVTASSSDAAEVKALRALVQRAEGGDTKALTELRTQFDGVPEAWEPFGDMARHAQHAWVKLASGRNLVVDEGIRKTSDRLRAELLSEAPSPLERLLVERIAICWVQVHFADHQSAAAMEARDSVARCEYWQRQQDRSHRRYLTAIRTLAQVRRLLRPSVQINVAENQVNVAG